MGTKIMSLDEFRMEMEGVLEGSLLGIGGQSIHMNPMGLIREVLKTSPRRFHLLASPVGGLGIDLLIGAGRAGCLEFAQVSLWEFGMAPNFRRAAEQGRIKLLEHT